MGLVEMDDGDFKRVEEFDRRLRGTECFRCRGNEGVGNFRVIWGFVGIWIVLEGGGGVGSARVLPPQKVGRLT